MQGKQRKPFKRLSSKNGLHTALAVLMEDQLLGLAFH